MPSRGDEVNDILLNTAIKSAQQKGETMPKGEQGVDNEVSITIRRREQVACVMEALHKAGYVHAQANGQPTASDERRLREVLHKAIVDCCFMGGGSLISWLRSPEDVEQHIFAALQSTPSSPLILVEGQSDVVQSGAPSSPPEVSHHEYRAGRGYLEPVMQPSDAEQPKLSSNLQDNTLETNRKLHFALDTLRAELRELEAKWRSLEWAKAYVNDERPSEFICADELHAVLAPAPHPAEKD